MGDTAMETRNEVARGRAMARARRELRQGVAEGIVGWAVEQVGREAVAEVMARPRDAFASLIERAVDPECPPAEREAFQALAGARFDLVRRLAGIERRRDGAAGGGRGAGERAVFRRARERREAGLVTHAELAWAVEVAGREAIAAAFRAPRGVLTELVSRASDQESSDAVREAYATLAAADFDTVRELAAIPGRGERRFAAARAAISRRRARGVTEAEVRAALERLGVEAVLAELDGAVALRTACARRAARIGERAERAAWHVIGAARPAEVRRLIGRPVTYTARGERSELRIGEALDRARAELRL